MNVESSENIAKKACADLALAFTCKTDLATCEKSLHNLADIR